MLGENGKLLIIFDHCFGVYYVGRIMEWCIGIVCSVFVIQNDGKIV